MDNVEGIILILSAITVSITTIMAAFFAGYIALKQLPEAKAATEQVHSLVNRNFTEQKNEIQGLQGKIDGLNADALRTAQIADSIIPEEPAKEGEVIVPRQTMKTEGPDAERN